MEARRRQIYAIGLRSFLLACGLELILHSAKRWMLPVLDLDPV
jgi:hypothetical protein